MQTVIALSFRLNTPYVDLLKYPASMLTEYVAFQQLQDEVQKEPDINDKIKTAFKSWQS